MTTWVALLRAVNLGPTRKLAMADLRAALEGAGFERVETFLQSGNAVFDAVGPRAGVQATAEHAVTAAAGFDVPVLVWSAADLAKVVDANPLVGRGIDTKELHVVFLARAVPAARRREIDAGITGPDEFAFGRQVVYVRLRRGVMGSRLPNWDKVLGTPTTMRTWNTVTRLVGVARRAR